MRKKKGYFSISVVAKMFSVHQQTIRMYEKEGLITPKRSEGNTRLFSEDDVDRLEEIINLTHKMGVNLAGVEMILKLQKKIKLLQSDVNKMFSQFEGQLGEEVEGLKQGAKKQAHRLIQMKQEGKSLANQKSYETINVEENDDEESIIVDDWEVEYEDKE